jgi:muramoyltetrapeptide carboxypeptidase
MLTHLHLAGVFQRVNGVVLGKFTNAQAESPSLSMEEVFAERFQTLNIPVLRGLMIGHVQDQATLPIGAQARLDSSKRSLRTTGVYLAD